MGLACSDCSTVKNVGRQSTRSNNVTGFVADDVGDVSVSSPTFFDDFFSCLFDFVSRQSRRVLTRGITPKLDFFFVSSQRFSAAVSVADTPSSHNDVIGCES